MSRARRAGLLVALFAGSFALTGLLGAPAASAHPLGNATVNHYDGLQLHPNRIVDSAVEDIAEIPTLQRKSLIDTDGNGALSDAERAAYASKQCAAMAASTSIAANGNRIALSVESSDYSERPGVIQLTVGRLDCQLTGAVNLTGKATLAVQSHWDSAGIGWHEITAIGDGVTLQQSPFPAQSISDELRKYPNDLLSAPLNVRSGSVAVVGGSGTSTYAAAKNLPVAGTAVRLLNRVATAFNNLVGSKHLTLGVGILAVLLAMGLGAGHAFLPGHGKTIMAAYLVGRRGRLRDVFLVGATVTITHTAGVLILGLIISITAAFSTTAAEQDLGILSGLIIAGVGLGLLISALVRLRKQKQGAVVQELAELSELALVAAGPSPAATHGHIAEHGHSHDAPHGHSHDEHDHAPHSHSHNEHDHAPHSHDGPHSHDEHDHAPHSHDGPQSHDEHDHAPHSHDGPHSHEAPHSHSHGLFGSHSHSHGPGFSKGGLVGLGVAGGLVPSPSALLVLLAAIALGRTAFGITLVLSYGIGMAGALTAAGLILVKLRNQFAKFASGRRLGAANRLIFLMPILTATLVLVVGLGLTLRAAHGIV